MQQDRRRFFRVEDTVGLKLIPIEKKQLDAKLDNFWNDQHQFSLRNEFNYQLDQHQADLQKIKNKMPELGRYLGVLQQQIDLLTEKVLAGDDDFTESSVPANISAQGISFHSKQNFAKLDMVEMHIQLIPSHQKIVTLATVVEFTPHPKNKEYNLSLDFTHIHEADQELLVKHIHARQLNALSAGRFSSDD